MERLNSAQTLDPLENALAGPLGDYTKLAARLWVLSHGVKCSLSGVTLRIHYPAFRSGKPTDDDLVELITSYISHFALPRTHRARSYKKFPSLPPQEIELECAKLRAQAVRTFIKAQKATKRNGEAGELMLFLLTEWMLGAPQVIAKMSLKTNPKMPVHGSDGVHVRFDAGTNKLRFYFGEAKIYKSLPDALTSAATSIAKALSPTETKYELELVEKHIDLSGFDDCATEALLAYLDPWNPKSNDRLEVITSLIAFDYDGYSSLKESDPDKRAAEFAKALSAEVSNIAPVIAQKLSTAGLATEEVEMFLLPLPSVSILREKFQALIGWS